jgi:translocation and assembly module TamA
MRILLWIATLTLVWSWAAVAQAYSVSIIYETRPSEDIQDVIAEQLPEEEDVQTALQARRYARRAQNVVSNILNAYGYFDPDIRVTVTGSGPAAVATLNVDVGQQFTLDRLEIVYDGVAPKPEDQDKARQAMTLDPGMPAISTDVIDQERLIADVLTQQGYAYADVVDRSVIGDRDGGTISVRYRVDAGPRIRFGQTLYPDGLRTKNRYLRRINPTESGTLYDASELALYNSRLSETRLFNRALAQLSPAPSEVEPDGTEIRDIALDLTERPRNTLTVGAGFDTTEGFGLDVELLRRNLTGRGDLLVANVRAAEREFGLDVIWRRPNVLGYGRGLNIFGSVSDENTEAFNQQTGGLGLGVEFIEGPVLQYSVGAEARYIRQAGESDRRDFQLVSLNGSLTIDKADSVLNPRRGWRADARVKPTYSFSPDGDDVPYVRAVAQGRAYLPLTSDMRYVLAGRLRLGTLVGANSSDVPTDERFFSGGGGSVRGYAFQGIGPFDDNDVPLGGRSLSEASIEGRARVTERIGAVAFVDAGNVSDESYPDFDNLRVGAGVGVRYITPAGPLRLDVATPLNPSDRDGVIQIYISIGQAF